MRELPPHLQLELDLALILRGKGTPGSGNKGIKGDALNSNFRAEAKCYRGTDKEGVYFPLDIGWLEEIAHHADAAGKIPLLAIQWQTGTRAVLVPPAYFEGYVEGDLLPLAQRSMRLRERMIGQVLDLTPLAALEKLRMRETSWWIAPWEDFYQARRDLFPEPKKNPGFSRLKKR